MSAPAVCPVCEYAGGEREGEYRAVHPLFRGIGRYACPSCGMVYAWPMPNEGALAAYNASYFENAHGGAPTDAVTVAFHSAINGLRVAHVERYVASRATRVASVLEIGPGLGHFARHWLANHPGTDYSALESDASCLAGLHRSGVRTFRDMDELITGPPAWDLLVLSHVLEHTTSPFELLDMLTACLRPAGIVFIEVPCRDWEHKPHDEPHLLFFDKPAMGRLLERLGLVNPQLSYHGQEISRLRGRSLVRRGIAAVRARLLARGVVAPFARMEQGLELVTDPLARAVVRPFEAHREQARPAWWLRAVAEKA